MQDDFTNFNELGLAVTFLMGFLTLMLPRRFAPIPMLAVGMYMTMGQILDVFGLHFDLLRIMLLFGWARLIMQSELVDIEFNAIDVTLLGWVLVNAAVYTLREMSGEALINRLGFAYDVIGFYFFFRALVRSREDCLTQIQAIAVMAIPLACLMILEKATGRNLFSYFGGVPEFTMIRDGKLRCQGPFRHPILAGTFGAAAIPLCAGLWFEGKSRAAAVVAAVSSTAMVVTSASSGPVLAWVAAMAALSTWMLRSFMREVRWFLLGSLVTLHLAMNAPVWYIFDRFSEILGGTGWHRSELINQAITRIDEWWLLGTNQTGHWMPYKLRLHDAADITNQYILTGLHGGLLTMGLFIAVIVLCFRRVGMTLQARETTTEEMTPRTATAGETREEEAAEGLPNYLPWALGSTLFVHVVSFISVAYFDQMVIYWYMLLAMIAALPGDSQSGEWSTAAAGGDGPSGTD